ncbi:MAG: PQQ-binding-like beta-propeller repeat protein [Planctomycetaceae bacterium]
MISRFTLAAFLILLLAEFPTAAAEDGAPSTAAGMQRLVNRVLQVRSDSPGICAVLGWDDPEFLIRLAKSSDLLIHAIDSDQELVAATQKEVDAAGLYGRRVVIERSEWQQLPYSNDMIDLVVAVDLEPDDLERLSAAEVLRTLRPLGVAIIGGSAKTDEGSSSLSKSELKEWLKQAGVENVEPEQNDQGLFAVITKPALEGADDWSHWEHGPDNNPVSVDEVIRAPYMTKWLGTPYYISMPAITTAAGGRLFNAIGHIAHHKREEPWLNTLLARNGYNGTILWSRKLPDGYLVHRSAFIATDDVFYMIDTDGSGCLMLDPETGDELGRLNIPGTRGQWKWMAIKNGVLFGLVGDEKDPAETTIVRSERSHWSWGELSKGYYEDRVPWGFGKRVFAYDLKKEERLWDHEEEQLIDSRSMVIGDDRLYLYSPDARLASLDSRTGYVVWTNEDTDVQKLIEQPGQGLASTPGFRSMTYCVHTPEALIYQAQTRANVVSISTRDGSLLWTKPKTTNNPNALFIDQKVALGIGENGTTLMVDPASGEVSDNLEFTKRSCARLTATADSLFCRGWPEGLTRYDRKTGKVSFNGAFRPACNDGVIAANGLAYLGPWPCDCNLMLLGRVAMTSAGDFDFSQPAVEAERLQTADQKDAVTALDESDSDWWTYRSGIDRSASTDVSIANGVSHIWEFAPPGEVQSTATTTAGGFVFVGASDGSVRAIDAASGRLQWSYLTAGPILHPPDLAGPCLCRSGDGYVYALEAATGELL